MPKLPPMRDGTILKASRRSVPFSFWPVAATNSQRKPVQSLLFASDPWAFMQRSITENISGEDSRNEAISYIDQASDFYKSALSSQVDAAKPLQTYYSYLNILKAFVLYRGQHAELPNIRHGISEVLAQSGNQFTNARVKIWPTPDRNGCLQAFNEFTVALGHQQKPHAYSIPIAHLQPQVLPGHRLWSTAARQKERFVSVHKVQFTEDTTSKEVWIRLYLYKDDLTRLYLSQNDVLKDSRIDPNFKKVNCQESHDARDLICLEQKVPKSHNRHGVDVATSLSKDVRDFLWVTVASTPPYRRYYLYLCPNGEVSSRLPQLTSIYALTFYLGSLTRYRPNVFRSILSGPYGPRIVDFISGQPAQFVYLMASEFAEREVTKPALV